MDAHEKISRMGPERSLYEFPIKMLAESGAKMAFNSDFPVIDFNPFNGLYAAVTRLDDDGNQSSENPDEVIGLADSLKYYTSGSACLLGRENEIGTLEEGKYADVTVVDRDLFMIPLTEIKDAGIDLTIMGGKEVFSRV
jgi:predicted amidohydrolase YtcJ